MFPVIELNLPRFLILVFASIYLLLWANLPLQIWPKAVHDDGWFISSAMSLSRGEWLGNYSQLTLIKGPIYPIFLLFSSLVGLSVQLSTAIFHLIAACLLYISVRDLWRSKPLACACFIIIVLTQFPVFRVMRDEISAVILICLLSLVSKSFLTSESGHKIASSIVLGAVAALLALTREDGIVTLLPIFVFIAVYALYCFRRSNKYGIKQFVKIVVVLLSFTLVGEIYKLCNYIAYGTYIGVELVDKDFVSAVNSFYRVRQFPAERYVDVTNKNLDAISKTDLDIAAIISKVKNSGWVNQSCEYNPSTCGQIGNGYFMWALRDSLYDLGYFSSPETSKKMFSRISNDINKACTSGILRCNDSILSSIPGVELFNIKEYLPILWQAISASLRLPSPDELVVSTSHYPYSDVIEFLNITSFFPDNDSINNYRLSGWFFNTEETPMWINLEARSTDLDGKSITFSLNPVSRLPSHDLVSYFHDDSASSNRFSETISCSIKSCTVIIHGIPAFDLSECQKHVSENNIRHNFSDECLSYINTKLLSSVNKQISLLHIDSIYQEDNMPKTVMDRRGRIVTKFLSKVYSLYNFICPYFVVLGIFSFIFCLYGYTLISISKVNLVYTSLIWVVCLTKLVFISLITYFWIPTGCNFLYLYPVIALLPIASCLSIYEACRVFIRFPFVKDGTYRLIL